VGILIDAATVALGVLGGPALESLELLVTQPLLVKLTGVTPNFEEMEGLAGNFKRMLVFVALIWIIAAFGEELFFRGYLMNRVADLGGRTRSAWAISLLLVSAVFGLHHMKQGITGVIDEGFMGLLLGLMYLGCGRSLSAPIVAHGVQDTVDIVLMYLNKYPVS
jgi:membrane protease YdiL (CAAX protease family)